LLARGVYFCHPEASLQTLSTSGREQFVGSAGKDTLLLGIVENQLVEYFQKAIQRGPLIRRYYYHTVNAVNVHAIQHLCRDRTLSHTIVAINYSHFMLLGSCNNILSPITCN